MKFLKDFFVGAQDLVDGCLGVNFLAVREFLDDFGNIIVKINGEIQACVFAVEFPPDPL